MLLVGDDWAEDHHDIEIQDENGHRLGRARLPEGIAGLARLHELIAEHLTDDDVDPGTGFVAQNVMVGIETDRGTWVSALVAAGYQVFPLNPVQVARYREAARGLRCQVRPRGRARAGRDRAAGPGASPADRR